MSTTGSSTTFSRLTEEKYQSLQDLFKRRDDLIRVQKFCLLWQMTLQRLLVPEENVLSLDLRDGGRLVGVWLKKRDYAGKIKRKEMAQKALQAVHEDERAQDLRPRWGPETVRTFGKQWDRPDYVAFDPPLYPPEKWLQACLK